MSADLIGVGTATLWKWLIISVYLCRGQFFLNVFLELFFERLGLALIKVTSDAWSKNTDANELPGSLKYYKWFKVSIES